MIRRQTSYVKDVQKSESMHLPEDLPYERCVSFIVYNKCIINNICVGYCMLRLTNISAECREKLALAKPRTVSHHNKAYCSSPVLCFVIVNVAT